MAQKRNERRPKTPEESLGTLTEYREANRLYSSDDNVGAIGNIVATRMIMLNEVCNRGKVDLKNIKEVEAVAFVYLDNCRKTGVIPTFEGLAFSLGYSRRRLYYLIKDGQTEVGEFLDKMRTLFADITQVASSQRLVDNATSIFVLKSMTGMGFSDKGDVPETGDYSDDEKLDHDEIVARYGHLLPE